MKRIHLLEPNTALVDLDGAELVVAGPVECDRLDCGHDHYFLVPEAEMANVVAESVEDTLQRLGLSGRAVS